ncbi:MAG: hypothetical protein KDA37_17065, partial [Planctomycetales bacterium]|nr:hypothetical protein [Planctomycetales bacterium]
MQCETCQSWLQVRQQGLLGQIHRCPKCGGMVHLVPSKEAPAKAPQAAQTVAAVAPANDFESVDQLGLDAPAETAAEPSLPAQAAEAATAPIETPEAVGQAPAEALGRRLAIGIGAAGTLLVTAGLLAFALTRDNQPVAQVDARQFEQALAPVSDHSASESTEPAEGEPVTALKPARQDSPVEESQAPADLLPELPAEAPTTTPPMDAKTPTPDTHATAASDAAAAETVAVNDQQPTREVDPLDYDPASLDLVMLRNPAVRRPARPSNREPAAPLVDPAEQDPSPENHRVASLDHRLAELAKDQRLWVERDSTAFEAHTPVDLARRLNDSVPELYLPDATLGYAIRVWGDLAGLPVTIDPSALSQAGVDLSARITLEGHDEALSEVLLKGLKPARLGFEERAGRLVLSRRGAEKEQHRSYDVSDLLPAGAKDASSIADLARRFALSDQAAHGLTSDSASLDLEAAAAAHFDLLMFCERLRKARGLKQRTRYPARLLPTSPSLAGLSPVLAREVTFSFVAPTPLADIVDHWRSESGLEMLVDWA